MGVDPGTHATAIAVLAVSGGVVHEIRWVLVRAKTVDEMISRIANVNSEAIAHRCPILGMVEGQYFNKALKRNPDDILRVALVAGAAACRLSTLCPVQVIKPQDWKGSIPKRVSQKRIAEGLGIDGSLSSRNTKSDSYWVPKMPQFRLAEPVIIQASHRPLKVGDWSHLMDAVGLARHAYQQSSPGRCDHFVAPTKPPVVSPSLHWCPAVSQP